MELNSHVHFIGLKQMVRHRVSRTKVVYDRPRPNKNKVVAIPYTYERDTLNQTRERPVKPNYTETRLQKVQKSEKHDDNTLNHVHFALGFYDKDVAEFIVKEVDLEKPLNHAQILPLMTYELYDEETDTFIAQDSENAEQNAEELLDEDGKTLLFCEQNRILMLDRKTNIKPNIKPKMNNKPDRRVMPWRRSAAPRRKRPDSYKKVKVYDIFEQSWREENLDKQLSGEESDIEEDYENPYHGLDHIFERIESEIRGEVKEIQKDAKDEKYEKDERDEKDMQAEAQIKREYERSQKRQSLKPLKDIKEPSKKQNTKKSPPVVFTEEITDALDKVIMKNMGLALVKTCHTDDEETVWMTVDLIYPCREKNVVRSSLEVLLSK